MRRRPAAQYPLEIPKGADFEKAFVYYPDGTDQAPRDWSGYTGQAQLRASVYDKDPMLEFTVTLGDDGSVLLAASSEDTAELQSGDAVWDLYITDPDGKTDRFLAGTADVSLRVTQ